MPCKQETSLKISVIFTTYNSPKWLEKVLWGFNAQVDKDFEVIIADDGSKEPTREVIERFQKQAKFELHHAWQPDEGFQKCRALNKAIMASTGDYIVMTDGDCIPRNDFVLAHRQAATPGCYQSGGYFKLPMSTSEAITEQDINSGNCFDKQWLLVNGVKSSHKIMKFTKSPMRANLYNLLTRTNRTWNGHNASCWKEDAIKVNGFDERLRYGGLDCEFGDRLVNAGIKPMQIRYKAICVHLDHARGYANEETWKHNAVIRETTKRDKIIETPAGIRQAHL